MHLFDVRLWWHSGHEHVVTVRARDAKHARRKAREFALSRTAVPPSRVSVRKLRVI